MQYYCGAEDKGHATSGGKWQLSEGDVPLLQAILDYG